MKGGAILKKGKCYSLDDKWDEDDIFYCRYIIYNNKENTIKIFSDNSNTNYRIYFRDNNYNDEDCVFSSDPDSFSSDLIKIISLEKFRCDVNEANRLKIYKKMYDSTSTFNIDDLEA